MPGLKLRRQHWCFLLILCSVLLVGIVVGLLFDSTPDATILNSPELQQAAVAQLLREVPLVDG